MRTETIVPKGQLVKEQDSIPIDASILRCRCENVARLRLVIRCYRRSAAEDPAAVFSDGFGLDAK